MVLSFDPGVSLVGGGALFVNAGAVTLESVNFSGNSSVGGNGRYVGKDAGQRDAFGRGGGLGANSFGDANARCTGSDA